MLAWLKGRGKSNTEAAPLEITAEELQSIPSHQYYVLDLRDLKAYRQGHIKGSHLIPFAELNGRMHELPTDRLIVTVDTSPRRARQAAKQLRSAILESRSLKGGISAWTGKLVK